MLSNCQKLSLCWDKFIYSGNLPGPAFTRASKAILCRLVKLASKIEHCQYFNIKVEFVISRVDFFLQRFTTSDDNFLPWAIFLKVIVTGRSVHANWLTLSCSSFSYGIRKKIFLITEFIFSWSWCYTYVIVHCSVCFQLYQRSIFLCWLQNVRVLY